MVDIITPGTRHAESLLVDEGPTSHQLDDHRASKSNNYTITPHCIDHAILSECVVGNPSSDGHTEAVTRVDKTTVYSSGNRDVLQDGYNRIGMIYLCVRVYDKK